MSSPSIEPGIKTVARIQVISSNRQKADRLIVQLTDAGHEVDAARISASLQKELIAMPPAAVVIDISTAPATGRDLGLFLRIQKATRSCLLIFLDGVEEKVEAIRKHLPDAVFADEVNLTDALSEALANPPSDPYVPESVFAGYKGRPLPAKLGIKQGMKVSMLNAPTLSLDPLPGDVQVSSDLEGNPDICLWFVRSDKELEEHLSATLEKVRKGKLWILWPKKSSGVQSDLTQSKVRKRGLDAGWVDFKVCSFDETWSGLCFTLRKVK